MNNFVTNKSFRSYLDLLLKIPMAMKITAALLFIFLFQANAEIAYSQSTRISLNLNNATVEQVLNAIEENSDFYFLYNSKLINVDRKVDVRAKEKSIESVLNEVFKNTNVQYKVEDKQIILSNKSATIQQQQKTISAVVMDPKLNEPIIGANVVIKGTTNGTITDMDGKFTLTISSPNDVILISYIGYIPLEIKASDIKDSKIFLKDDTQKLEEIVVVGYGTQKKLNLTGAVAAVSGEAMTKRPVVNPTTMLQGQVPGLRVNQGLGQPGGESVSIRVRGQGTFSSAGSDPLILINGVPGDLNNLDPSVIESVSVLKDAASASIYGARAANGVILVTTKQGSGDQKNRIAYHGNLGVHSPTKMFDIVTNSVEYMELANLAKTNSGLGDKYPQEEIDKYRNNVGSDQYPNFDWIDYMFNPALVQNHNLSLAGSSEKSTYNVALNYVNQDGTLRGYNYKKYNMTVDLTSQATSWMRVGTYIGLKYGDKMQTRQNQDDAFLSTLSQAPTYMPWLPDDGSGIVRWTNAAYDYESHNKNMPAIIATGTVKPNQDFDINGQIWTEITLAKGLSWYTKGAARLYSNKWKDWRGKPEPLYMFHTGIKKGELDKGGIGLSEGDERLFYTNLYSYLKYDFTTPGKDHSFSIMAGYSQENEKYQSLGAYRRDYPFELQTIDAGGTTGWSNSGSEREWALMSGFGRLNYNFKDRYLLEVNTRYDGSSRISEKGRWGIFPSFSLGWRLTEEEFVKKADLSWLSNAKLRGSWGQLGNQNIGFYPYQAMISSVSSYPFDKKNESLAYTQTAYANQDIKWETTTITDLGVDLQLFNRLSITFDWYKKATTDILRGSQVSYLLGLSAPTVNNGSLENQGVELALNWSDRIKEGPMKGLDYNVGFFFDRSRNKLTKFGDVEYSGYGILQEGLPYGEYYMLDCIGVFADQAEVAASPKQFTDNTQPGDLKYRDANGDGKINNDDRVVMSGRFPGFEYSINLGASWKGFDLTVLGQGVSDKKYYIDGWGVQPFRQGSAPTKEYLQGMWTPEKPNGAKHPKLYWDNLGGGKNTRTNSYFLRDASYFRLKNLTLGYSIPKQITDKAGMSRLRVYFSADNLLTLTNFEGLDPERGGDGRAAQYPQNRIVSFGLNVEF